MLLARSFAKKGDLGHYFKNRVQKNLIPYVAASLFFSLFHLVVSGNSVWNPSSFWEISEDLLTGKASFHLYFTLVSLQAAILVPLLVTKLNLSQLSLPVLLLLATLVQEFFHWLQRSVLHLDRPGSTISWYVLPLFVGLYLSDPSREAELRGRGRLISALTVVSGLSYIAASTFPLFGWQTYSDWINLSFALYSIGIALTLWRMRENFPSGATRRAAAFLGRISLPLFLVHPLVMYFLGGPKITTLLSSSFAGFPIYLACTYTLSIGLALLLLKIPLTRILLGEGPYLPTARVSSGS